MTRFVFIEAGVLCDRLLDSLSRIGHPRRFW